ncbi:MAG TPA: hypothetical protein VGM90_15145 [Kofleriaceae bacterium]|jgi:hypothetical protein
MVCETLPGETCDHCDGRGWWASGCDGDVDCFQCHGTGKQRAQGNCEHCLGWGWSIGAQPCAMCTATGWVDKPVALFRCSVCRRTEPSHESAPHCPRDPSHVVERVSADRAAS